MLSSSRQLRSEGQNAKCLNELGVAQVFKKTKPIAKLHHEACIRGGIEGVRIPWDAIPAEGIPGMYRIRSSVESSVNREKIVAQECPGSEDDATSEDEGNRQPSATDVAFGTLRGRLLPTGLVSKMTKLFTSAAAGSTAVTNDDSDDDELEMPASKKPRGPKRAATHAAVHAAAIAAQLPCTGKAGVASSSGPAPAAAAAAAPVAAAAPLAAPAPLTWRPLIQAPHVAAARFGDRGGGRPGAGRQAVPSHLVIEQNFTRPWNAPFHASCQFRCSHHSKRRGRSASLVSKGPRRRCRTACEAPIRDKRR
jgi:hypothetical protein